MMPSIDQPSWQNSARRGFELPPAVGHDAVSSTYAGSSFDVPLALRPRRSRRGDRWVGFEDEVEASIQKALATEGSSVSGRLW